MEQFIIEYISKQLQLTNKQVVNSLELLEEGNTIPFIARYRKEATSGLDEEGLRQISELALYQENLLKHKEGVINKLKKQEKLSDELEKAIMACDKLSSVDDLYRPFVLKKKTKASEAIELGLEPLADIVMNPKSNDSYENYAKKFLNDKLKTIDEITSRVIDIIAQRISDNVSVKNDIVMMINQNGYIMSSVKKKHDDNQGVYQIYYDFRKKLKYLLPYQLMAMERGENEKVLTISFDYDVTRIIDFYKRKYKVRNGEMNHLIHQSVDEAINRLVIPRALREIRKNIKEAAHEKSIDVFSLNLERLLSAPPLKHKMVLGFDPAFRTGCKLAVVDEFGNYLDKGVIYPHAPHNKVKESEKIILDLLKKYPIQIIAIGNGTASRESESFVGEVISKNHLDVSFTLVSEAGASVYSASELARKEFPDLEVQERSAISIARRILDPLGELIKIDPQSIGVGQYQHDVSQKRLKERLDFVVDKVVNRVGVNLNTASVELLKHISGLTMNTAMAIVDYRKIHQGFKSREELLVVKKMGAKTFQQAAGFLRIEDGINVYDQSGIHPESYELADQLLSYYHIDKSKIGSEEMKQLFVDKDIDELASHFNSDHYTIESLIEQLCAPLKDYRDQYEAPLLRQDIMDIKDLHVGEVLEGVVRNVVDFGVFVDVGLHDDGLLHISKISKKPIAHPSEVLGVGDIIKVLVDKIDLDRGKIQLSLLEKAKR